MFDLSNSFLFMCLVVLRYIIWHYLGTVWFALSVGLALTGAAAQAFLSRSRRGRWVLPLLYGGALAGLAVLYHLNIQGALQLLRDEGMILYCVLGAEVLCASLGAAIGQLAYLARESFLADGRTKGDP